MVTTIERQAHEAELSDFPPGQNPYPPVPPPSYAIIQLEIFRDPPPTSRPSVRASS
ncbi:hypothetical protein HPP92_016963 [Vanilla planifolia]|uniref:Uncharacterized protein n=1 Tax=Vanilla planifolia TaxID=51239 RepID=A0A835USK3_VANPL|nr:hypothetical protein HPP92_028324 [Vanilla planifolia]KAG0472417.1 hypothetical protein HPP92_016963 [Vanilla planifolia]